MSIQPMHYTTGHPPAGETPLERFVPPPPTGMITAWLQEHVPAGGWVIDPLGANPYPILEAARAGYRVLVACNNPVIRLMLEVLAAAPRPADFNSVLAALSAAKRGDERLELHLQTLYQTRCPNCGSAIAAQSYLWHKGENLPRSLSARCPVCQSEEEQALSPDQPPIQLPGSPALHRSRALERVALPEDSYRPDVSEALQTYLDRPLYVLFTLINKSEGLLFSPQQKKLAQALFLSACDRGNTLWPAGGRAHPRQLTVPPVFHEYNLWLALENAISSWCQGGKAIPVTQWPALPPDGGLPPLGGLPPQGGICIYAGRMKTLGPFPPELQPAAIVSVFPRPNQAFWTLSALWSGWIWGREAALPLKGILERRRFDWNWHTLALYNALTTLRSYVPAATPFLGLLSELSPGFLSAAALSAAYAGFTLNSICQQPEDEWMQMLWSAAPAALNNPNAAALEKNMFDGARAHLTQRLEPAPFLDLLAAGLLQSAQAGCLPLVGPLSGEPQTELFALTQRVLNHRPHFRRLGSPNQEVEKGLWWLSGNLADATPPGALPLSDRVETDIVNELQNRPWALDELVQNLNARYPGLLTPPVELIRQCLESYAEYSTTEGVWKILPTETARARREDLEKARQLLVSTGQRLGLRVEGKHPITWITANGQVEYTFYLLASSIISRYVLSAPNQPPARCVLVFPGGRARLLSYKLQHNPLLAEQLASGWHLLKFRHLRDLALRLDLNLSSWNSLLDTDPPVWENSVQISMF